MSYLLRILVDANCKLFIEYRKEFLGEVGFLLGSLTKDHHCGLSRHFSVQMFPPFETTRMGPHSTWLRASCHGRLPELGHGFREVLMYGSWAPATDTRTVIVWSFQQC